LAKKKPEKPRRELTRRQHSRWQQQKRRQRIILSVAILIVVAVLSVVGVGIYQGWYVKDYKPLHETVLEVNGIKFDMEYYIKMLKYYTKDLSPEYISFMTGYVVDLIERNELVKQEAAVLGITVSDDEVDELMNSLTPPLEEDYRDLAVTQLVMQKMRDEYFEEQVPLYADQRHIMAMFLESEAQTNEVIARIEAGESFTDLAAELSLDDVTKEAGGDLGWRPLGVLPQMVESTVLEESAFSAEVGVLSQPIPEETKSRLMGYWLVEVISVDTSAEPAEAQVRMMLLGSEQEANDIRARLEAGEDFAALATEFSQHTASSADGGEMTVSPGDTTDVFDAYVFNPGVELGVLSPVIKDDTITLQGGYWLIEVVDSEIARKIDDENRLALKNAALNNWLAGLRDDPDNVIVNNLDDEKTQWAVTKVMGG
jgi:parvulin-like peptidyl-prolyl isomerase